MLQELSHVKINIKLFSFVDKAVLLIFFFQQNNTVLAIFLLSSNLLVAKPKVLQINIWNTIHSITSCHILVLIDLTK
jgi:hypothetical protein